MIQLRFSVMENEILLLGWRFVPVQKKDRSKSEVLEVVADQFCRNSPVRREKDSGNSHGFCTLCP
jgi:hypothetical protein